MPDWTHVCAASKVEEGEPFGVKLTEELRIAVYRVDDAIYATNDVCPHAFALLSTGFLDGHQIECPLHGAIFDVRTGKCHVATYDDVRAYKAEVRDGDVFVDLDSTSS
ncbi:MAG: non-heme iron oxygenase ferredoxin subunit [Methylobacteriaceae bacterium]|nr:non-heme iron oxygenase ferredoxin subunit [Methylobacteriaceae bacterium]